MEGPNCQLPSSIFQILGNRQTGGRGRSGVSVPRPPICQTQQIGLKSKGPRDFGEPL
jgi:hypothetical protein